MINKRYLSYFLEEAEALVPEMKRCLDKGEHEVLRKHVHTIRGSSSMIGLDSIAGVAAMLEELLKSEGKEALEGRKLQLVSDSIDYLEQQIDRLNVGKEAEGSAAICQRYEEIAQDGGI